MKIEKPKASREQLCIARAFKIPSAQAHLINLEKAAEYQKYRSLQKTKDERFLDNLGEVWRG
jgi:hypothetical protein